MSMFAIPGESTVLLMERFYDNWLSGESRSTALRHVSRSFLHERREANASARPLFWGRFILVGTPDCPNANAPLRWAQPTDCHVVAEHGGVDYSIPRTFELGFELVDLEPGQTRKLRMTAGRAELCTHCHNHRQSRKVGMPAKKRLPSDRVWYNFQNLSVHFTLRRAGILNVGRRTDQARS